MASSAETPRGLAIVTGTGPGGIGEAIAIQLATEGYRVVGTSTTPDGAEGFTESFRQLGLPGVGVQLDLSDPDSMKPWYKQVTKNHGKPTFLVNNAGVTNDGAFFKQGPGEVLDVLTVNYRSPLELARWAALDMRNIEGASVLAISSVVAATGNKWQTKYAASKGAMDSAMLSAAVELGGNPKFNSLAPGAVDTKMWGAAPPEFRAEMLGRTVSKVEFTPTEIAMTALWILRGKTNGKIFDLNDGLYDAALGTVRINLNTSAPAPDTSAEQD